MNRTRGPLSFLLTLGVTGWTVVLGAYLIPGFGPSLPPRAGDPISFLLFLVVIVATRALAFPIIPKTIVSLDAAFYVAAVIVLGSAPAGRLVALALTLDAALRLARAEVKRGGAAVSFAYVLYYGGMTGGLLTALGWLTHVDGRGVFARHQPLLVVGAVLALGVTFLAVHYAIQTMRLVLGGHRWGETLRHMTLPGILAESTLLPLGAVAVMIFDREQPLGFALLAITHLVVNAVWSRLARTTWEIRKKADELETLLRSARAFGATLQQDELLAIMGRETLAAVPGAEAFALCRGGAGERTVVDFLDRQSGAFERRDIVACGGLAAHVSETRRPLCLGDAPRGVPAGVRACGDPGIRSWCGVPLVVFDEVVGVLSVQSHERAAFSPEEQRILEAIGAQAAVAIGNARLYELATVDGLTGLYVRRYFDSRLREELERSRRYGSHFAIVLLDIDDFKQVNDTHGHAVGDRVLREVARAMRKSLRGVDLAARYGGEEFALLLPRTASLAAHTVAERVREDIAETRIAVDGVVLRVTASLGVAGFPESGETDAAGICARADSALYRAKASGKNRVELFLEESLTGRVGG